MSLDDSWTNRLLGLVNLVHYKTPNESPNQMNQPATRHPQTDSARWTSGSARWTFLREVVICSGYASQACFGWCSDRLALDASIKLHTPWFMADRGCLLTFWPSAPRHHDTMIYGWAVDVGLRHVSCG